MYMNSVGAYSVQAIQSIPPIPPRPYPQHQAVASSSMIQLPPQSAAVVPIVPYPNGASAHQHRKPKPKPSSDLSKLKCSNFSQSVSNLMSHTTGKANATIVELEDLVLQSLNGGKNVRGATSQLLDRVITLIDLGSFCGKENELGGYRLGLLRLITYQWQYRPVRFLLDQRIRRNGGIWRKSDPCLWYQSTISPRCIHIPIRGCHRIYRHCICKYAGKSRLPLVNDPFSYPATYPLLRLAAQYSRQVYDKPHGRERQSYVNSDWRHGTKAMVIKSLPIDDMNTIVFAIRGTQNFMDWAVNVHTAPVSPSGFLDDPSNRCHAGFLSVARKMVAPVAARLRTLIEEDPSRMSYNLLITGHSAGGALASLLYLHMISESLKVSSELTHLRGCFRQIHCVTFGAPPVTLRPRQPPTCTKRFKSMFFAFINEGDPVARADKDYFFSLLDLYVSPTPGSSCSVLGSRSKTRSDTYWRVPPLTLSNVGRLVLLRGSGPVSGRSAGPVPMQYPQQPPRENVVACGTTDAELRGLVFGDPFMHSMDLYCRRIETLARGIRQSK